jgi:hypothetical protein
MKRYSILVAAALIAMSAAGLAQSLDQLPFAKKLKLAKVGDEDAQVAVAMAYETGSDTKLDAAEAAKWYREAALQGNVEAQFRLARIVSKGAKGLKQDYPTAIKLYEAAAAKGHAPAMNALGLMHENGEGVTADPAKAAEWFRKAADANLADAENNLGMLYLNGRGIERDLGEAFKLFERAAAQGDGWGLNNLGGMHEMGWGTQRNRDKAAELYKQAAAKGIAAAQDNLQRLAATP